MSFPKRHFLDVTLSKTAPLHPHCWPRLCSVAIPSTYHHGIKIHCIHFSKGCIVHLLQQKPTSTWARSPVCLGARSRAGAHVFVRWTKRDSDVCRQLASHCGLRSTGDLQPPLLRHLCCLPGAPAATRVGGRKRQGERGRNGPAPVGLALSCPWDIAAGSRFSRSRFLRCPRGSLDHEVKAAPVLHKPADWEST